MRLYITSTYLYVYLYLYLIYIYIYIYIYILSIYLYIYMYHGWTNNLLSSQFIAVTYPIFLGGELTIETNI